MLLKKIGNHFFLRTQPTQEIISLLSKTTLGTSGAKYRLLDVEERINELDNPLYFSLERNTKAIANVTFCRRNTTWYLRFFAFDQTFQTKNSKASSIIKSTSFSRELDLFFEAILHGEYDNAPNYIYAYIDPQNVRSKQFSERFNFQKIGQIVSQSFSRRNPRSRIDLSNLTLDEAKAIQSLNDIENNCANFTSHYFKNCSHYGHYENNQLLAFASVKHAHWKIEKMPGIFGSILPRIIPFIPILRKIIKPERHHFIILESIWLKHPDTNFMRYSQFLESICFHEKTHVIMWWCDLMNPLWNKINRKVNWGPLHFVIGNNKVDLVARSLKNKSISNKNPYHVIASDLT